MLQRSRLSWNHKREGNYPRWETGKRRASWETDMLGRLQGLQKIGCLFWGLHSLCLIRLIEVE